MNPSWKCWRDGTASDDKHRLLLATKGEASREWALMQQDGMGLAFKTVFWENDCLNRTGEDGKRTHKGCQQPGPRAKVTEADFF